MTGLQVRHQPGQNTGDRTRIRQRPFPGRAASLLSSHTLAPAGLPRGQKPGWDLGSVSRPPAQGQWFWGVSQPDPRWDRSRAGKSGLAGALGGARCPHSGSAAGPSGFRSALLPDFFQAMSWWVRSARVPRGLTTVSCGVFWGRAPKRFLSLPPLSVSSPISCSCLKSCPLSSTCWTVGTGPVFPVKLPCLSFSVPSTPLLGPASSSAKKCLSFLPVLTCSFKVRVVCPSTDPQSRDRAPNPFWVPGRPQTRKQNNPLSYSPVCTVQLPLTGAISHQLWTFLFKVIQLI